MTKVRTTSFTVEIEMEPWSTLLRPKKLRLKRLNGDQLEINPVNRFHSATEFDFPLRIPANPSQEHATEALSPQLRKRYAESYWRAQLTEAEWLEAVRASIYSIAPPDEVSGPLTTDPDKLIEFSDRIIAAQFGAGPELNLLQRLQRRFGPSLELSNDSSRNVLYEQQNIEYQAVILTVNHNWAVELQARSTQRRNATLPRSEIDIPGISDLMESRKKEGIPNVQTVGRYLEELRKKGRTDLPTTKTILNRVATHRRMKSSQ